MSIDPDDPDLDKWLRSLETRSELTIRYAQTGRFPQAHANRQFFVRIDQLLLWLQLIEDELVAILSHADRMETHIERHMNLAISPPDEKTMDNVGAVSAPIAFYSL
jgi:hypothetical protein